MSDKAKLVAFTLGNDMSARDIEGENPLYLPQAKLYKQSCALGPWVLIPEGPLEREKTKIGVSILRKGKPAFEGTTDLGQMVRTFEDLIGWLARERPQRCEIAIHDLDGTLFLRQLEKGGRIASGQSGNLRFFGCHFASASCAPRKLCAGRYLFDFIAIKRSRDNPRPRARCS